MKIKEEDWRLEFGRRNLEKKLTKITHVGPTSIERTKTNWLKKETRVGWRKVRAMRGISVGEKKKQRVRALRGVPVTAPTKRVLRDFY